ncbi:porin [Flavobacterium croceum]|uniref:Putative OmpL-like beta-barrel porin-2 n=1 Tax=Flavobacterium croceum DSM 17960 TaxID=1121886 RepID=A0A2S4N823_9FLAO|nr:porin [Flavobacterium croceum]POS01857.1 putative OmpL-like beta-barrel porin-2 [Flavobacterium croceum DSM 17960]
MKQIIITFSTFLLYTATLIAQNDTIKPLVFQGYGEIYYSYDFSNPQNHEKQNFIYSHKRHNEINLNLAFAKVAYNKNNLRANATLMIGNYAQYNLLTEPTWAQFIYEANVGFKISRKQNVWLDAGIMPSHIGFESAISADCWTLTRSILAENSPYYETGIKISYTNQSEKLNASFLVLNGWQKIKKPDYIQNPSFGVQLNYKPNTKLILNYSNFIGTDKADSIHSWRLFHNLYAIYKPSKKFGLIAGFDFGTDKFNTTDYGIWYSPVFILQYKPKEKYNIALRGEYYNDKKQILITTNTPSGFNTFGVSTNFDMQIKENLLWRIEAKEYLSEDKIFNNHNANFTLSTSLAIKFQ